MAPRPLVACLFAALAMPLCAASGSRGNAAESPGAPALVPLQNLLLPAPLRYDAVHDDLRDLVYLSAGDRVLRFRASTGEALEPIVLGGQLGGIDLSPDRRSLAVADRDTGGSGVRLWLVDPDTLQSREVRTTRDFMEGGLFTVVWGGDGRVYTTSTFNGSGWVPMRRFNPATDTWNTLASVRQNTMLSPSGDALTIAFAEANISDGAWGLVDLPTGAIVRRSGYSDGTSWFNYEIGTDRFGDQFLLPTYGGGMVYNATYQRTRTLGAYAGQQPVGIAFHPVEARAFMPWAQTNEVREYDTRTWSLVAAHPVGHRFDHPGNWSFQSGRTRLSRDGSLLMVSVPGGVLLRRLYAPLSAPPASIRVISGRTIQFGVFPTVGNGGAVGVGLASSPASGFASPQGAGLQYRSNPGFVGSDAFRYRATYGRAMRDGDVHIEVVPNRPPVAQPDSVKARRQPVLIPVLQNDVDPDGDSLRIVAVSTPDVGEASIEGGMIRFHPPFTAYRSIAFTYTIADVDGATSTATVTVVRR